MLFRNPDSLAEYKNEFELPFNIEKVKSGIKDTFLIKEAKILKVSNQDETIGSYRLVRSAGAMRGCIIELNVKKKDEENTTLSVMTTNTPGNKSPNSILSGATSDYIQTLVKAIKGEIKPNKKTTVGADGKKGCAVLVLVALSSFFAMSFFF